MKNHSALAGVLMVSGALLTAEFLGESKAHADYNVPATVAYSNLANGNATSQVVSFGPVPMNLQTEMAQHLMLTVKG